MRYNTNTMAFGKILHGGHNGREETTTLTLIPLVKKAITIPLIAAGGIGSGPSRFVMCFNI